MSKQITAIDPIEFIPEKVLQSQIRKIAQVNKNYVQCALDDGRYSPHDARILLNILAKWRGSDYIYDMFQDFTRESIQTGKVRGLLEDLLIALCITWEKTKGVPAPFFG